MKRRDTLRALTLSSFGIAAINPQELLAERREMELAMGPADPKVGFGRTEEEAAYDARLMKEKYFTAPELATLAVLSDIIIPADKKSGSASQSGVPQFIEFMVGVAFFNVMRNFTATGFFSSKIGIDDIGYMGNRPNQWEGVPADVLKKYGFA